MTRIAIDNAGAAVKQFIQSLPMESGAVELELDGHVVCRVMPPGLLPESEKAALLRCGRELVERSRQRNSDTPARVVEGEVRRAVQEVRRQQDR
jgi:hypothetical protein